MTRFRKLKGNISELVDLLEETYGLDPYLDDSPWANDGYDTCKEWLKSKVGQQGTYSWREPTPTNEDISEEVRRYYHEALINNIASVNMLFDSMHNKFDCRVVEFAPYKPILTTEENSEE